MKNKENKSQTIIATIITVIRDARCGIVQVTIIRGHHFSLNVIINFNFFFLYALPSNAAESIQRFDKVC